MDTALETALAATLQGDYGDDASWEAVHALQSRGDMPVFEAATAWLSAEDPLRRARAADILAQLKPKGAEVSPFAKESSKRIQQILDKEHDALVLQACVASLGHLADTESIPSIIRFADHADQEVRFSAAFALGSFPNDPDAICALMKLADDVDGDVRDWAIFALGSLGTADSEAIRNVFARHTEDDHHDARQEAIAGLAHRHDSRVLSPLVRELEAGEDSISLIDAANVLLGTQGPDEVDDLEELIPALIAFGNSPCTR